MDDTDHVQVYQYTITDTIETDPFDITRLWKFTVDHAISGLSPDSSVDVEVFLTTDESTAYESNMDTDDGTTVELLQVPQEIRERLSSRLERDVDVLSLD